MRGTLDDILRSSSSKHTLDLSHYHLDDEGARRIAKFLNTDKFVKKLNLTWNEIWPEGARALSQALASNSSLEHLDLSHNSISTEGAEHFARALRDNKTLKILNLSDNNITDEGITCLVDSLAANQALVKLEIEGNPIFDAQLKLQIKDSLYSNSRAKPAEQNAPQQVTDIVPILTQNLEEAKQHNKNLKKSLDKLRSENNTLKNRSTTQETRGQELTTQLNSSIQERISLEKSLVDVSTKLERERAKAVELVETQKQRDALKTESKEAQDRVAALNAERRALRNHNETLTKRIALLTGAANYESCEIAELTELENELEQTIKTIRTVKLQRLHRKLDESLDARKCKVCFEGAVDTVLIPCGHHILCQVCSLRVAKCPVCTTAIQNRIHTYES